MLILFLICIKKDIKISYLTEIHYKHIHTIKNSSNQVEALPKSQKGGMDIIHTSINMQKQPL